MSVSTMLDDAKNSLADLKRKYKFKKANDSRKEAAELQSSMAKCRGQLEICTKEFKRTITTQCRNIAEGKKQHADTLIQEQILWDAAIGYMLVKHAIYAIKTINSHDSISHAYDMLDAAVAQMSGKKNKLLDIPHLKKPKDRNAYGYIASGSAVKEKEMLLDSFFETLKETADIDACLESAYNMNNITSASSRNDAGADDLAERLKLFPENGTDSEMDDEDIGALKDIHKPEA